MIKSRWFSESEFNKCTPRCSLQDMDQELMYMLDAARDYAQIPIVLNCAYRSVAWDKSKGRLGTSAHTLGKAVDIRCNSSTNRYKLIVALIEAGFNRVGIAKTFIHVDMSGPPRHSSDVVWLY